MALSHIGSASNVGTTSLTLTIPACSADDILVAAFTNRGATADPSVTDDDTGGNAWQLLKHQDAGTSGAGSVWWKRATSGTSGKTITASGFTTNCAGGVSVYRGSLASGNPFCGIVGKTGSSTINFTGPNVAPPDAACLSIIAVFATSSSTGVSVSGGFPRAAATTESFDTGTTGTSCACESAFGTWAAPVRSSDNFTGSFTASGSTYATIAFSLLEAASEVSAIYPVATIGNGLGTETTSFDFVLPDMAANDVAFLCVTNRDATADPSVSDSDGNWTKLTNQNAGTNGAGTVWYKRATANSTSMVVTVSGLTGSASGVGQVVKGAKTSGAPLEVGASEANAAGNETQVGFTPSVDGCRVVFAVFNTSNDTLTVSNAACTNPGTLTNRIRSLSSGGSDCAADVASRMQPTKAATGNFTWSQTNGQTASIAFAILPGGAVLVAVPLGSLALTGNAPSAKLNIIPKPGAGALSLTGQVPIAKQIIVTRAQPGAGALSLSSFAPSARLGTISRPGVGLLSLSAFAPAARLSIRAYPGVGALTVNGFAASAKLGTILGPGLGSLILNGLAPSARLSIFARPGAGALLLTGSAPLALAPRTVKPDAGVLSLVAAAPSARLPKLTAPPAGSLSLAAQQPAVIVGASPVVFPGLGSLLLAGSAPVVLTPRVIPIGAGTLSLAGLIPAAPLLIKTRPGLGMLTLAAGVPVALAPRVARPGAAALDLTAFAPAAFAAQSARPGLGTLDLTGFVPAVASTANVLVRPGSGAALLSGLVPVALAPRLAKPASGALTLSASAPGILISVAVQIPLGGLVLSGAAPIILAPRVAAVPAAALSVAGLAPAALAPRTVRPGAGQLDLAALVPLIAATANIRVNIPPDSLLLAGLAPMAIVTSGAVVVYPGEEAASASPRPSVPPAIPRSIEGAANPRAPRYAAVPRDPAAAGNASAAPRPGTAAATPR